ncbi:MAG TPA: hypothetical protein VGI19_13955 [Candidatus Cybelea sp.]|jgi:hypothetical protein
MIAHQPDNNVATPGWKAIEEQLARAKAQHIDPLTLVDIEDALCAIGRSSRN